MLDFEAVVKAVRENANARDVEEVALRLRNVFVWGELANVTGRGRVLKVHESVHGNPVAHIWLQDSLMGFGPKEWVVSSGARRNFIEQKGIQR